MLVSFPPLINMLKSSGSSHPREVMCRSSDGRKAAQVDPARRRGGSCARTERRHTSTFMTRSPLAPAQPIHLRKRDRGPVVNPEPGHRVEKTRCREDIMTLNGAYRSWVRLDAVRSTIRWFTYKFWTCISHHLSHFATVFIERRAKGSNATGCNNLLCWQ